MPAIKQRNSSRRTARSRSKSAAPEKLQRESTISRWGNSLGIRIPQEAANQLKLTAGTSVSLSVNGDSITIRPVKKRKKWTEAELLKGVTPEMVGGEIDWGPPVGKEVW